MSVSVGRAMEDGFVSSSTRAYALLLIPNPVSASSANSSRISVTAQGFFALITPLMLLLPQHSSEMTPPSGTSVSDTSESHPSRTLATTLTTLHRLSKTSPSLLHRLSKTSPSLLHRFSKTSPILLQPRSAPRACKASRRSFLVPLPPPFGQLNSSSSYIATSVVQCKWHPSRATITSSPSLMIILDGLLPFRTKPPSLSLLLSSTTFYELNVFTESTSRRFGRTAEPSFRAI